MLSPTPRDEELSALGSEFREEVSPVEAVVVAVDVVVKLMGVAVDTGGRLVTGTLDSTASKLAGVLCSMLEDSSVAISLPAPFPP